MFDAFAPASTAALIVLAFCFLLVLAFEFSNGFHDTANAVATVIYTHSLKPAPAVVLSGVMNFGGVLLGGIAVAFTLVELLPPDTLTPPDGNPAIGMLLALFLSALFWNVATWYFGIPNSSSHAIIGALVGVALANSLTSHRGFGHGVDLAQIWSVLRALLFSPLLGFIGAGLLFRLLKLVIHDRHLFEPTTEDEPPIWWVRGLLIVTCSGVSFTHGSNDGQKSIGLIMLTVIGLVPAGFALNRAIGADQLPSIAAAAEQAGRLIERYGDDQRPQAMDAAKRLADRFHGLRAVDDIPDAERPGVRDAVYRIDAELKLVTEKKDAPADDKNEAGKLRAALRQLVEYAPWWVRVLSAVCLGTGTMVGYKRIVTTIGERIGRQHMSPAQGASAELVGAALIGTAGYSGLPVSTTHIITSGVAGTMVAAGAGVQPATLVQIVTAWVLTLPATIALSAGLFYLLAA